MDKEIKYVEPSEYFPKEIRDNINSAFEPMPSDDIRIKDLPRLINTIHRFVEFIKYQDKTDSDFIDFGSKNGFLGREENYKTKIFNQANEVLNYGKWTTSMIGTGKILEEVRSAVQKSGNLIYINSKMDLLNKLNPKHKDYLKGAEKVLFDIYKSSGFQEEKIAFESAKALFGGAYDRLAFLFFLKSCTSFLPISPGHFDDAFYYLNIDYKLSSKCSWANYCGFIQIVTEIQSILAQELNTNEVRLIDAHSFLWIVSQDRFQHWTPSENVVIKIENKTEQGLRTMVNKGVPPKSKSLSYAYKRSTEVVKLVKARANGICRLCNNKAPFIDKKGEPFLEVHHIVWLSKGGEDSSDNAVALCPNCHRKMHILNDINDIEYLSNHVK